MHLPKGGFRGRFAIHQGIEGGAQGIHIRPGTQRALFLILLNGGVALFQDRFRSEPVEEDGYFSATQVSRQRARDEALEVLQSVVDSESADEATKTEALLEIADLARAMEAEANIETMVIAKGFERCVAVINGDTCSVVVNGTELQENQISQINEIVYEQAGILPANIRIVTK